MRNIFVIILLALLCVAAPAKQRKKSSSAPTTSSVKKEQAENNAQIKETQRKLEENKTKTRTQLNALNSLNGQINDTKKNISDLDAQIDQNMSQQQSLSDSIAKLQANINKLKVQGSHSLRDARRKHRGMSDLGMLFSSESLVQLLKRSSYIQQANQRAVQKANRLQSEVDALNQARQRLETLKSDMSNSMAQLAKQRAALDAQQSKTQALVNDLKKQGESLKRVLAEKREKARKLDNQLERLIREEQQRAEKERKERERKEREKQQADQKRQKQNKQGQQTKPADNKSTKASSNKQSSVAPEPDAKLSGSFASNKGSLLFPVSGRYTIVGHFGRNTYKDLPGVETQNSGIDIEVKSGTNARAAFDGTVSSIFYIDGFQNVVMLRHGQYLTVYGHIKNPSVAKGDKVKAGQNIGSISPDPLDGNRTILHFEVRKETTKLNPLEWVRR